MAKERKKKVREKINWKKEAKLAPGYIIILLWVFLHLCFLDGSLQPACLQRKKYLPEKY